MDAAAATSRVIGAFRSHDGIVGQPAWLAARRKAAIRSFSATGFPTRIQEAWRFTNLRPLTATPFLPRAPLTASADAAAIAPLRLQEATHRIVLVDGAFAPELSDIGTLPAGVWLGSMAEAAVSRPALIEQAFAPSDEAAAQPLAALNTAFFTDGFVLALEPGVTLELPVEIIHYATLDAGKGTAAHLRNLIVAGAGSSATVVETVAGSGAGWTNAVTAILVADTAVLRHAKVQGESDEAVHTALTRVSLSAAAKYDSFHLITGARMSRQDVQVVLAGEGAAFSVAGAYLLRGEQEATFAPFVDHAAFGCETNEVLKGVLQERSHGVFLGTIVVRPSADQTSARQLNRNLLMSDTAWVDTKPELEINADDVKCSHGATIGSLDEMQLFYLMSRGIDEALARQMLVEAYAADTIELADLAPGIRDHLRGQMQAWLAAGGTAA